MGALDDSQRLWSLSIPGSHDSAATIDATYLGQTITSTARTQSLTIREQLDAGVRFLDIRLVLEDDVLEAYHGVVKQNITFSQILSQIYSFLDANTDETVVMSVKEEGQPQGTNPRTFESAVESHISTDASRWSLDASDPTLGQVRGKIVLLKRFTTTNVLSGGIDVSQGWADNQTFTLTTGALNFRIQDSYGVATNDLKWATFEGLLNETAAANSSDGVFLNFLSGFQMRNYSGQQIPDINIVSTDLNTRLASYLASVDTQRLGVVSVDFASSSLSEAIFLTNFGS